MKLFLQAIVWLWIPCVLTGLLLFSGCESAMGPVAIPDSYSVVPVTVPDEEEERQILTELQTAPLKPYRILGMDRFSLLIYEQPDLSLKDVVVTPDGYLSLPLVGAVHIGGMTLPEATQTLVKEFSKYIKNPLVSLMPSQLSGYNFTIAGKINRPGRYPIIGDVRVSDTIAMASGLTEGLFNGDTVDTADLENAYVARDGQILPVNLWKAVFKGDRLHNIPLRDGDYIYIPSMMNTAVYVLGEVDNPTYVGYKEGLTLLQTLSFTQGMLDSRSNEINVIRGGLKKPTLYRINLQKILDGEAMDFRMEPNDIVYVPKSGLAKWNVIVREIIPTLQGLNMLAGPFGSPASFYNAP